MVWEVRRVIKAPQLISNPAVNLTNTWTLFISWRGEEKNSDYGLLPVTTGFTMATVSRGLCVCRSEAGVPAALRSSMTHNINHFIEVGQILMEIQLGLVAVAAWEKGSVQQEAAAAEHHSQKISTVHVWTKVSQKKGGGAGSTGQNSWVSLFTVCITQRVCYR